MSPSVHQISYDLLHQGLRAVLLEAVESGAADLIELIEVKACAALYGLLLDHPVDRRGRCRSCRRPGALFGWRRRRCRVRIEASFWLHQPDHTFLLSRLTDELGRPPLRSGSPRAGWPDRNHGGAGEIPDGPRPRRAPPDDQSASRGVHSFVLVAGTPWRS